MTASIIKRKATEADLKKLGVENWSPWSCEPSTFDWEYADNETAYVQSGKVTVKPEGGEEVVIEAGDLVTFPRGMKCVWTVHETIRKVYKFNQPI